MKVTVTQKHLKQALSELKDNRGGYCQQCVLAVAARELFPSETVIMAAELKVGNDYFNPRARFEPSNKAQRIADLFDFGFDGDKSSFIKLRKMLPTTVVFKEISQ